MKTYDIRKATTSDCAELNRLVNSAYRGESSQRGWTTEAEYLGGQRIDEKKLSEDIARPGSAIYCLRETPEGPILGCVYTEFRPHLLSAEFYFGMLAVNPELQAQGIGRFLLDYLEGEARQLGAHRVKMMVIQIRDTLIAWYERRGYRRTGETAPFPYGDPEFGLPKRADLHFVVLEKPLTD